MMATMSPLPRMPAKYRTKNRTKRGRRCPGLVVSPSRVNAAPSEVSLAASMAGLLLCLGPQGFLSTAESSPQCQRKRVKGH